MAVINSPTQSIEIAMIKADTDFYRQLIHEWIGTKHSGILAFGLTPYISLYVVESNNYFQSRIPGFGKEVRLQNEDIIRASRTRIKLFNDSFKDVPSLFEHLQWILTVFQKWMNVNHTGWFGIFQKWIQPDLGLYYYNDHLISNTQAAFFNLGFEKHNIFITELGQPINLDKLSHSVGYELGQYLGALSSLFSEEQQLDICVCKYQLIDKKFCNKDVKAQSFFSHSYNGSLTVDLNFSITLFLMTANFLIHVFHGLVLGNPDTWFKIKFLTLYHITLSLAKLRNYFYKTEKLSEISKTYFKELLDNKELKFLTSQKDFRDILVHYVIKDTLADKLQPDIRFFGLIEHFFQGSSFEEINAMVDSQLQRISSILEAWQKIKTK